MVSGDMATAAYTNSSTRPVGSLTQARAPILWPVQLFRGVAALMVVAGHTQSAVGQIAGEQGRVFNRSTFLPWGAGVDLFFIISGFIMVHASTNLFGQPRARTKFLRRRFARIVPLYWVFTAGYIAILAIAAAKGGAPLPGVANIASSFIFLPFRQPDGSIFPVFSLGWTLNYEFGFYLLFAVAVGWKSLRALAAVSAILLVAASGGLLLSQGLAPLIFFTRPIVLEFDLGLAVGVLHLRGWRLPAIVRITLIATGILLFAADLAGLFSVPLGATVEAGLPRVLSAGLPAAIVLAGAVLGPLQKAPRRLFLPMAIGDASYSLYLVHAFVLIGLEKLVAKSTVIASMPLGALTIVTIVIAIGCALLSFRWIERPLTAAAGHLLSISNARPFGQPATVSCL